MRRGFCTLLLVVACSSLLTHAQSKDFGDETATVHASRLRTYDVKNYSLRLKLDYPEKSVSGSVSVTLSPLRDGLNEISLDSAELQIQKVEMGGVSLNYRLEGDKLRIALGRAYSASET